jgi:hypothetical protein
VRSLSALTDGARAVDYPMGCWTRRATCCDTMHAEVLCANQLLGHDVSRLRVLPATTETACRPPPSSSTWPPSACSSTTWSQAACSSTTRRYSVKAPRQKLGKGKDPRADGRGGRRAPALYRNGHRGGAAGAPRGIWVPSTGSSNLLFKKLHAPSILFQRAERQSVSVAENSAAKSESHY